MLITAIARHHRSVRLLALCCLFVFILVLHNIQVSLNRLALPDHIDYSEHISNRASLNIDGAAWSSWVLEEIRTGRWTQPHDGAFCPSEKKFCEPTTALPEKIDKNAKLVHVTSAFEWIYESYGDYVRRALDSGGDDVKVTHRYPTGEPCRSELIDTNFLAETERELGSRFNAKPHPTNGRGVYRLSNPGGFPEPSTQWVSELWHIDNFSDMGFKILVYFSPVDDATAPFEYQDPPTFVPVLPKDMINFTDTRLNYVGKSKRVTGAAGTAIIFKNSNLPHKGNYCSLGVRDVVVFHFLTQ